MRLTKVVAFGVLAVMLGVANAANAATQWTFNFSQAGTAEPGAPTVNCGVATATCPNIGPVDEIKYTGETAAVFTGGGLPGSIAGSTFTGYTILRIDQFFNLSVPVVDPTYANGIPALSIPGTHEVTAMVKYVGTQDTATTFTITSAQINIIFDGPNGGYTFAADWSAANLPNFTDQCCAGQGFVVESGTGTGTGSNQANGADGSSDLTIVLTDLLHNLQCGSVSCDNFEIFDLIGALLVALLTDNNNQLCDEQGGGAACTAATFNTILSFATAYFGDVINTAGCNTATGVCADGRLILHSRNDGSATKEVTVIPFPATVLLLGVGMLGAGIAARRRRA